MHCVSVVLQTIVVVLAPSSPEDHQLEVEACSFSVCVLPYFVCPLWPVVVVVALVVVAVCVRPIFPFSAGPIWQYHSLFVVVPESLFLSGRWSNAFLLLRHVLLGHELLGIPHLRFRFCDFWDIALCECFHSQVLSPNGFLYQDTNLSGTLGLVRFPIRMV